ncbi:unannotated protein [freshwater metagenome]|uniref:Unannotated protein n=1 Tax=freshwater metagenome TaxID=449393 RepID=A0A6J7NJQ6_9ZZZZ|nr:DUF4192 family protein [Actinomycetota bacterium]MSX46061.1 DUF4192 family protein [Actinomycetota bacterium]MSX73640.1 DUF4192 family protein [Actinomycetota bacterium]MSZ01481.1 DUF4192 family protein [Actinomycetota bacterium]MTA60422.1 DUF4192 family protein [Actinomycetota bacterium]
MTTDYEELQITSLPLASDATFVALVNSFYVDPDSEGLSKMQQDGATAVIDLAVEFEKFGTDSNPDLIAKVLGRLSDIQVRDFALGTHNAESFETYWIMWHYLVQIAPAGYVAPVATLFATLAYERGDVPLAYRCLERASQCAPTYSLTILLRRVFGSGWPAAAFAAMRIELHPKVTAGIFE